jgi:phosphatidylglycerophosphatase A
VARVIASFFGTGLLLGRARGSDLGSGTVGGLAALGLALLIDPWWGRALALFLTLAIAWPALAALKAGDSDPGWVVIDEVAGTFLATLGLGARGAVTAFLVFRIADVFKRAFPGVAQAERLGGVLGVVADDLVAGAYGLAAGWLVQSLIR